jgi:hypothetical protein
MGMTSRTLEERVAALEDAVARLLSPAVTVPGKKEWRSTLGMFADDPMIGHSRRLEPL